MLFFAQDLFYFYGTIYGGLLIGLLFDINRAMKLNFKIIKNTSLIFDILFWLVSTIVIFITINKIEFFELRYYHFIALLIGFLLYYIIISKFVLYLLNTIIGVLKSSINYIFKYIKLTIESIYYVLIYTIHLILDILFYIINLNFFKKKVIRKKYRN